MRCLTCWGAFSEPESWHRSKWLRDPIWLCARCAYRWRTLYRYDDLRSDVAETRPTVASSAAGRVSGSPARAEPAQGPGAA